MLYLYSTFSTTFPCQIKFDWLQQLQSYQVLVWPLSNFHEFKNVCSEDVYDVKTIIIIIIIIKGIYRAQDRPKATIITRLQLICPEWRNFQNNNRLNNFLVITKTTEHGDVQANQHNVSSSLYWEQLASAGSWWVCKATEGLCKSTRRHNEHSQWMQNLILCWYHFYSCNFT